MKIQYFYLESEAGLQVFQDSTDTNVSYTRGAICVRDGIEVRRSSSPESKQTILYLNGNNITQNYRFLSTKWIKRFIPLIVDYNRGVP